MKLCSITPLKYEDLMYEEPYVMLLAHLSQRDEEYTKKASSNNNYKIMDNSIIELGEAFTMDDLIKEATKCKVDEIILPDVYQDGKKTIEKVKESIEWLKEKELIGKFKLMAVCHGKDAYEFFKNFRKLNKIKEIDCIGIPKVLSKWCVNRESLVRFCLETKKQIHLLGVWDSLSELKAFNDEEKQKIRSVDTCMPALLSVFNKRWDESRDTKVIDLENTQINEKKYKRIMKKIKRNLNV